jgi:hypothetical protein
MEKRMMVSVIARNVILLSIGLWLGTALGQECHNLDSDRGSDQRVIGEDGDGSMS